MMMESILFIVEPIDDSYSVQYELIDTLASMFRGIYSVYVFSPYIGERRRIKLRENGINVIGGNGLFLFNKILSIIGRSNESMLWMESWARESFFGLNRRMLSRLGEFDHVINMTTSVYVRSEIWWIQGKILSDSLDEISKTNENIRGITRFVNPFIRILDRKTLRKMSELSRHIVTNASHLRSYYMNKGVSVDGVIYTPKDFSKFRPSDIEKRDYVLTYIGKETDVETILDIAGRGIRIVGFGSKIPVGISTRELRDKIDFRGYVSDEELVNLYSGARFTAFPFTEEPFGYVPIESMACGTPVLSYDRQGPSETIINGKTGWLVPGREEFIEMAVKLWEEGSTISREECTERASEFSPGKTFNSLMELIVRGMSSNQ